LASLRGFDEPMRHGTAVALTGNQERRIHRRGEMNMTMNNNETFVRDTNKSTLKVKTSIRGGMTVGHKLY
jgi:hypothetical protein